MDENENRNWIWCKILIEGSLIGDEFTTGSGYYERTYCYISIPEGYGYDGYCFKLSVNCIDYNPQTSLYKMSIRHDMRIELMYNPELREPGKRYPRYKMFGEELVAKIFDKYENDLLVFLSEEEKRKKEKQIQLDKECFGRIVCGLYKGNFYDDDPKYDPDMVYHAYFTSTKGVYRNSVYEKVRNVKVEFEICENVSRHFFYQQEEQLNRFLATKTMYEDIRAQLDARLQGLESQEDVMPELAQIIKKSHKEICDAEENVIKVLKAYVHKEFAENK